MNPEDPRAVLLAALGRQFGIDGLTFDSGTSTCALVFERQLTVHLAAEPDASALLLFATLGGLVPCSQPELATAVLRANYLWRGSAGATLSLDPVHDVLLMARRLEVPRLTGTALDAALASFVEVGLAWQRRLQSGSLAALNSPSESLP